jgi:1,4-dihydroxy-2-naphthoate octaprenyltransferase
MQPAEPTLAALPNAVQRYFLATRPAFLSVTLFGSLIGLGTAHASDVAIAWPTALVTLVFALLAHAGVNVLNDYYDALNGTDEMNIERVYPYTGGSRFIQNGVLTLAQTARFGVTLFAAVMLAGIWLAAVSGRGLLAIGLAGLVIGWGYSAAPLKLNSRGVGELCVMAGFALIVIGTDYVQRYAFALMPIIASVSYALLVTNVLYMNQFPDRKADAAAGKRHWVVRLPPEQARWGYVMLAVAANAWLIGAALTGALPALALIALVAAIPSAQAAADLFRYATQPRALTAAIRRTIAAALLHGLLLAGALFFSNV